MWLAEIRVRPGSIQTELERLSVCDERGARPAPVAGIVSPARNRVRILICIKPNNLLTRLNIYDARHEGMIVNDYSHGRQGIGNRSSCG